MHTKILLIGALVVSLVSLVGVVGAQAVRRDGRWEVSAQMDMPGMTMPAIKTTQCVTKEQVDSTGGVPQGPDKTCKVSDFKTVGNKVTWSMKCEGQNAMSGTGEITYGIDTYDGLMKISAAGTDMTMKYTGKRLGDCTK